MFGSLRVVGDVGQDGEAGLNGSQTTQKYKKQLVGYFLCSGSKMIGSARLSSLASNMYLNTPI